MYDKIKLDEYFFLNWTKSTKKKKEVNHEL